jgi:hypothetical protein
MPQAGAFVLELLYVSPKGLELADLTAKGDVVMNQFCRSEVPLCDVFPTPLAYLTPIAVNQINLVTVNLTENPGILRTPSCPVKPILK